MSSDSSKSHRSSLGTAPLDVMAPWPMPQWLPDETFFSLASRYHAISGNRLPAHTNLALFGMHRAGSQHDLPTHLNQFVHRTEGRLGSVETIAGQHTILPFYLPSRSKEDAAAARESLADPPNGMLKYRLGILTSRFRANHPLKACLACLEEDEANHGVAYWHRVHQLPGVWVCQRHDTWLREATLKSSGVNRFGWLLPAAGNLKPVVANGADRAQLDDLRQFAALVEQWSQLLPGSITAEALAATYRSALEVRGFAKDRKAIAKAYSHAISRLRVVPELAALPATPQAALHQVNRWIFAPHGGTHPLRHLSFIFWLFRDWKNFWSMHVDQPAMDRSPGAVAPAGASHATDPRRVALVGLIRAGAAATAAAKVIGVDPGTAMAWAAAEGIPTCRRPKTLKEDKYVALIADLKAGASKADAATRNGVSLQSVTRVLRTEVGLHDTWHSVRMSMARAQARSTWTQTVSAFAADGIAAARRHAPSAYAWLYRNDRSWLAAACADIGSAPRRQGTRRLDWDSRDSELASEVRHAAAALAESGQETQLKLWQLYQLVPELKAKLGALDRLPLTRKVISEVTRARKRREAPASLL